MPWSGGRGSLLLAINDDQDETDCGTDRERPGTVAHVHRSGSRASGVLVRAYVRVTLQFDCLRIGLGNVEPKA